MSDDDFLRKHVVVIPVVIPPRKPEADPKPPPTAPAVDIFDWHYSRSIADGIDPEDAELLAHSFVGRYAQ